MPRFAFLLPFWLVGTIPLLSNPAAADEPPAAPRKLAPLQIEPPAGDERTAALIALGKQLFFDTRLSGDNRLSCASCHLPDKAFADGLPAARGSGGKQLSRNTPTLLNVAALSTLTWDGRVGSLAEQALLPIAAAEEMNQDLDELERELADVAGYAEQFRRLFDSPVTRQGVGAALAAFEATLVTGPSPLDRYLGGDKSALSKPARRGMELFVGEAGCIRCHHGPLLSDGGFYRLGVSFRDRGRGKITGRADDEYKFRTPPLRNVAVTAPYMHDGSLASLTDVVEFYFRGAPSRAPRGLTLDIEPLTDQSFSDIDALAAFLEALSGEPPAIEPPELP